MTKLPYHAEQQKFSETIKLEAYFSEEQKYIWKNMVKIEKIKKQSEHQKNFLLHRCNRSVNA